ncbi:heterokaryon incompatibility protein-domain-containing protein [Pestalotiopsis sp. NC0098]|nr:heterokaryon incompatibility protein-domain-containing protein [Pestalotiopsis sp. NC0098]
MGDPFPRWVQRRGVEIIHASFDQIDILEYEALSYVWGSPELTSSIYVKDQSLRITKNLELVLRDLRLVDQDRLLWVDGLCIDQKNDREKTHQVRQMRDIYQRAESVLFYLGHSKEPQHILHNTMLAIQEQQNLEPGTTFALVWDEVRNKLAQQYTNFETRIRNSVESTLEAPWFRRVWIIQEVANARRASIYSGGASFRVAGFVHLVRYLDIEIEDHQTAILEMMPKKRRSQSPWSHQQDLLSLLRRFRHAEATQNHDKIFALLGMCMDGRGHGTVTVDYEKKEDLVIREVVSYISFCEKDDVEDFCSTIKSVKNLLGRVDSLLQDLLVHLAIRKRLKGLRSLLWYRRDESLITESILKAMIEGRNIEPEAVDVLPAYISDRTMMTIDVVSGPVIKADIDILRIFLTHISDAFIVARVLNSALFSAPWCRDGSNNETIRHLLNSSIKISQDLSLAARDGNADSIWKLLEKGADINMIDPNGVTPLGWAAASGQKDMVEFLLGLSANIETGHQSPLSLAVEHGHKDIVQLLLDRDANIESSDRYGRTPLSLSASGGCRAILSLGRSEIGHERLITIMKRGNTHHLRGRFDRVVESSRVKSILK